MSLRGNYYAENRALSSMFFFGNHKALVTSVCKMVPIKTDVAAKIFAFSISQADLREGAWGHGPAPFFLVFSKCFTTNNMILF